MHPESKFENNLNHEQQGETIPTEEALFSTAASPHQSARLFTWKDELYRAIPDAGLPLWKQLHDSGLLANLIDQKLFVETEQTNLNLAGAALILKHRKIPFLSYPYEWCSAAFQTATLQFLELNIQLAKHGLATTDVHPWNLVFDGTAPVFVDYGSFVSLDQIHKADFANQFRAQFWHPLRLLTTGQSRLARVLMQEYSQPIREHELPGSRFLWRRFWHQLTNRWGHSRGGRFAQKMTRLNRFHLNRKPTRDTWIKQLQRWKKKVKAVKLPQQKTFWSDYYATDYPDHQQPESWSLKQRTVSEILSELQPKWVHDLAGNSGWYSELAIKQGANVVCTDYDDGALNQIFQRATSQAEKKLTTAYLNLVNPVGPHGTIGADGRRLYGSVENRLQAECLLALGITHHLVFTEMFDFPFIFGALSQFTKQSLIVEFVSKEDEYVKQWWDISYSWYTLEAFCDEAKKHFKTVEVKPSSPAGRYLVVCKEKRGSA